MQDNLNKSNTFKLIVYKSESQYEEKTFNFFKKKDVLGVQISNLHTSVELPGKGIKTLVGNNKSPGNFSVHELNSVQKAL